MTLTEFRAAFPKMAGVTHHRMERAIMKSITVLTFLADSGSTLIGANYFAQNSEHVVLESDDLEHTQPMDCAPIAEDYERTQPMERAS